MNVLIVEDDDSIASFIVKGLREHGHLVTQCGSGESGLRLALDDEYDVAVVDIMLPGMDGLELIETLRGQGVTMPVLILSAKRSVDDRVFGLQHGGDDYLTKPFALAELHARLHSLVRRASGQTEPSRLIVADLTIDLFKHEVRRAGRTIELTPREFDILVCLARNAGRPVNKSMLLESVWGHDFDPKSNVVESFISVLRSKIDDGNKHALIHTLRGIGYVLKDIFG